MQYLKYACIKMYSDVRKRSMGKKSASAYHLSFRNCSISFSFLILLLIIIPCALAQNSIVLENQKPGSPPSEWDVSGAGDPSIQGFATEMSVNRGEIIRFKV